MTETNLLAFAAVYAIAVASPGPAIALIISRSLGRGLTGLPWFIAGFVVGDLVLMTIAVLGLAFIAQSFGTVFQVIRWAGVAYLLWMAYKLWTAAAKPMDVSAEVKSETPLATFLSSLFLTLGNPKAITFFVSIMPLAVDMTRIDMTVYAELALTSALLLAPILIAYAVVGDRARRVFRSEAALRRINRGSAVGIAGAALVVATRSD
jgi:threonine/homoserine/homoserine lactone efflux protein